MTLTKQPHADAPELNILHPKDAGIEPVGSKFHLQYKRWRWQRGWKNVTPGTRKLPRGYLRVLREDVYRVPEGFHTAKSNKVTPSGTYTSFVLLGRVNRAHYENHYGMYNPEGATPIKEAKRTDRQGWKPQAS